MHTSLILYAEHEFNASTFTARVIAGTGSDMYSAITGAIGALKGPKHGGANEFAFDTIGRYDNPDDAEQDIVRRIGEKQVIIGFGHPVYTVVRPAQPDHQGSRPAPVRRREEHEALRHLGARRGGDVAREEDVPEPRLVQRRPRTT